MNQQNLLHNFHIFKKLSKNKIGGVIKSNAYGHGFLEIANILSKANIDYFIVDSIAEAVFLRKNKIQKPILILGYTKKDSFKKASINNIELTISSFENLTNAINFSKKHKLNIHIKLDTGMHRQGFQETDILKLKEILNTKPNNLNITGIYSHLLKASSKKISIKQNNLFKKMLNILNLKDILTHLIATEATFLYPNMRYDMTRIGLGLYGIYPSLEKKKKFEKVFKLKPVLSWHTIISEIKYVKKGETIGYKGTYTLTRDSKIGICPIGYWHGYTRKLSNLGYVLVNNKKAKILGNISMDMICIDLTNIDCSVNDTVTLINEEISIEKLSKLSDNYTYEFATRLNPKIKKIIK
ncbi:MAG: alanine racemase [Candidatus Pacebacteria bacterium]|nr:alanine racemase [Candidatus Paceibacterota bacterium]